MLALNFICLLLDADHRAGVDVDHLGIQPLADVDRLQSPGDDLA